MGSGHKRDASFCEGEKCAGGVGANQCLRQALKQLGHKMQVNVFFPRQSYCTDNAAMVAYAGYCRHQRGDCDDLHITVHPRWPLSDIN